MTRYTAVISTLLFSLTVVAITPISPEKVCARLSTASANILCLKTIRGSIDKIDPNACGICDNLSIDETKIQCMSLLAAAPEVRYIPVALDVCARISTDLASIECLKTIQLGRYFDDRATKICDVLSLDTTKIDCMKTIRDRHFDLESLRICSVLASDSKIITCLREARY